MGSTEKIFSLYEYLSSHLENLRDALFIYWGEPLTPPRSIECRASCTIFSYLYLYLARGGGGGKRQHCMYYSRLKSYYSYILRLVSPFLAGRFYSPAHTYIAMLQPPRASACSPPLHQKTCLLLCPHHHHRRHRRRRRHRLLSLLLPVFQTGPVLFLRRLLCSTRTIGRSSRRRPSNRSSSYHTPPR